MPELEKMTRERKERFKMWVTRREGGTLVYGEAEPSVWPSED